MMSQPSYRELATGNLDSSSGPYARARNSYYVAIGSCGPIEANRQPTDCDTAAYDFWEKPMVGSLDP